MSQIVIVDYGMANLRSVQKAFEKVGHAAQVSSDPECIRRADKLVLPGVGAFRDGIASLRQSHLDEPITAHVRSGKPFFGICLGLQMLFTTSHEDGVHCGLDIFPGEVMRFPKTPGLKVPHMGWNQLRITKPAPQLAGLAHEAAVYFVHSYFAVPRDRSLIAAETDYGVPFASAIWQDNVFATQFHPEKSQQVGLAMLKNFAAM